MIYEVKRGQTPHEPGAVLKVNGQKVYTTGPAREINWDDTISLLHKVGAAHCHIHDALRLCRAIQQDQRVDLAAVIAELERGLKC